MSKKTIIIEPQENIEALAAAVNEALSAEFGVEVTADGVVCPFSSSGIGFQCAANSNSVNLKITNAYGQTSGNISSISYANTSTCALDIYRSSKGTAIAAVLRLTSQTASPSGVIAVNGAGECTGMITSSNIVFIRESENGTPKAFSAQVVFTGNNPAFALVKFPDIYVGVLFEEIYLMLSAPTTLTPGMLIHADNRDFVPVRATTVALAIPI